MWQQEIDDLLLNGRKSSNYLKVTTGEFIYQSTPYHRSLILKRRQWLI